MPGAARLSILMVAALSLALSGCSTIGPGAGSCVVPRVQVEPTVVHPGDTITVVAEDACDVRMPDDGWVVGAGHVGGGGTLVHVTSADALDGSFRVELQLPDDFPIGEAYAGIENWDYSTCPDNASCASPTGSFTVEP